MSDNLTSPPGPFASDYATDPLAVFDVFMSSALAGLISSLPDAWEVEPAGITQKAGEIAIEAMLLRRCWRDKIAAAAAGVEK